MSYTGMSGFSVVIRLALMYVYVTAKPFLLAMDCTTSGLGNWAIGPLIGSNVSTV